MPYNNTKASVRLIYAAKLGDVEDVKAAVKAGADLEARDSGVRKYTALHWSTFKRHINVVIGLLNAGADVDARAANGYTALHISCKNGDKDIALLLIGRGADIDATNSRGETPLMIASSNGHKNLVAFLLGNAGADADLKDNVGWTAIHHACYKGQHSIVHTLDHHGADIKVRDDEGIQAIHLAAGYGNDQTVSTLILLGADVNCMSNENFTPLYMASQEGNVDVVETLLHNNACNIISTQKWPATHVAAKHGHINVLMHFKNYGFDLNTITNNDNNTPLHIAVQNNHENVVQWLILNGGDPFKCNTEGETPIHIALNKRLTDLVSFMASKNRHSTFSGVTEETHNLQCAVCLYQRTSTVMTLPCRHAKTCQDCMDRMEANNDNYCPICRAEITQRIPIYL